MTKILVMSVPVKSQESAMQLLQQVKVDFPFQFEVLEVDGRDKYMTVPIPKAINNQ